MSANLDSLKLEVERALAEQGFSVFHGQSRALDSAPSIYWDMARYPDYRKFLAVARSAGVKMMVFHHQEFTPDLIDDAMDRLEASPVPHEESRGVERRLKELRVYEGFTCSLELSFDCEGRTYLFETTTEWYDEFSDILDEIDMYNADEDEDDEGPISGYFSQN